MNANTKEKYDNETKNFETLKYNLSDNTDILLDNSCNPDANFFNKKFQKSLDTPYLISGDNTPLKLPGLHISNKSIERKYSIKFLRAMLDEHIAWNNHIHAIEKKLAKNIGLLYGARQFLDKEITSDYILLIYPFLFKLC